MLQTTEELARNDLSGVLDQPAPPVSLDQAASLARDHFGLSGRLSTLTGERDRNFHLAASDGREYVLKVVHPAEDPAVTDFQNQALLYLAQSGETLPVPRVHPPLTITWKVAGEPDRLVRVYSWLAGRPMHLAKPSTALRHDLGSVLARLGLALRGFSHPAQDHVLLWDIQHALRTRRLLSHIDDPARRALPERLLDIFEQQTLPVMRGLRRQVIHNDFNPHNVLVDAVDDERIAGVIDFGDMVNAPLVQDLATASAYHIQPEGHPLAAPAELLAAYHAVCPLEPEEVDILFDLMTVRTVISVAISGYRAKQQPDNADYILRNYGRAWSGLERLAAVPRAQAQAMLHAACKGN